MWSPLPTLGCVNFLIWPVACSPLNSSLMPNVGMLDARAGSEIGILFLKDILICDIERFPKIGPLCDIEMLPRHRRKPEALSINWRVRGTHHRQVGGCFPIPASCLPRLS